MTREHVMVVAAEKIGNRFGFIPHEGNEDLLEIIKTHAEFKPRDAMETNPAYKQIIPYVIFQNNGKLFLMERTTQSSEKRLHHTTTIGVGGHVNTKDMHTDHWQTIHNGLYRELDEEIHYGGNGTLSFLGYINLNEPEVSRVHLGLLFLLETPSDTTAKAKEISGEMVQKQRINPHDLEGWSQIALNHLNSRS